MLCLYINLDRQTERRAFVETSFAQFAASAWQLQRIPAIDAETAVTLRSNSRLRPVETACFLSHVKAIETALQDNGPVMICEDDVRFGPQTSRVVPKIISELYPENWDLLFTDIGFGDPKVMIDLFRLRQGMMQKREVHCLNLWDYPVFFGATAYIVNHRSKQMTLDYLQDIPPNVPYDLALRDLITGRKLKARFIFPYVTSLSRFAEVSTVQLDQGSMADTVWNEFRRLMWIDRTPEILNPELSFLTRSVADLETHHFSRILEILLSPLFQNK